MQKAGLLFPICVVSRTQDAPFSLNGNAPIPSVGLPRCFCSCKRIPSILLRPKQMPELQIIICRNDFKNFVKSFCLRKIHFSRINVGFIGGP